MRLVYDSCDCGICRMDLKFMTSKLLLSKFGVSLNLADKAVGSRSTTKLLLLKKFSMAKLMAKMITS